MCKQIRDCQICQVKVGGCLHVLVPADDKTGGDVAEDANDKDDKVDDADGENGAQRKVGTAKVVFNEQVDILKDGK